VETTTYIQLPDGTWSVIFRSMTYGEIVIILLLVALLILYIYDLWTRNRAQPHT
jgi:hypothetical protein